jgi:hypothetical protein
LIKISQLLEMFLTGLIARRRQIRFGGFAVYEAFSQVGARLVIPK